MLKAISFTQPWASLVAGGAKRVETRSWPTFWRGTLAIHASKEFPDDARALCFSEPFRDVLMRWGLVWEFEGARGTEERDILPTGAIVAVCQLTACVPTEELVRLGVLGELESDFGNYDDGRYGFLLENIWPLREPVPCRGALNVWDVPPEVEAEVRIQEYATRRVAATMRPVRASERR